MTVAEPGRSSSLGDPQRVSLLHHSPPGVIFSSMTQDRIRETERLRQMTADEKVRVAQALWRGVWSAAAAGVRARHPDWSEPQVQDACVS